MVDRPWVEAGNGRSIDPKDGFRRSVLYGTVLRDHRLQAAACISDVVKYISK